MKSFNPKEFTKGAIAQHTIIGGYDDVRFEGILCSATFNGITGEKSYFTVDKTGKVLNLFDKALHSNPSFSICMKETNTSIELMPNGKPRIVEVVRFFRTWDYDNIQINSFGGMTAICVMDYALKQIRVFPSFCHPEDNFSKVLGLSMARVNQTSGKGFVVDMIAESSLKDNIEFAYWNDGITWLNVDSKRAFDKPLARFINE